MVCHEIDSRCFGRFNIPKVLYLVVSFSLYEGERPGMLEIIEKLGSFLALARSLMNFEER